MEAVGQEANITCNRDMKEHIKAMWTDEDCTIIHKDKRFCMDPDS